MSGERAVAPRNESDFIEEKTAPADVLSLIIEASPDIIYIYDRLENKYPFVSGRCREILGFAPGQLRRRRAQDVDLLIHPDDRDRARAHYARQASLRDQEVAQTTYRVAHAGGGYRLLRCRQKVFSRCPNGVVKCILGVATDITDQANGQRELDALRAQILSICDGERRRLALRLHDTVIQHLVGAALLLKGIEVEWCEDSGRRDSVRDILAAAQASLSRALREMVEPLVP